MFQFLCPSVMGATGYYTVTLCYVMLRYVMLRYVMHKPCYANRFQISTTATGLQGRYFIMSVANTWVPCGLSGWPHHLGTQTSCKFQL